MKKMVGFYGNGSTKEETIWRHWTIKQTEDNLIELIKDEWMAKDGLLEEKVSTRIFSCNKEETSIYEFLSDLILELESFNKKKELISSIKQILEEQ